MIRFLVLTILLTGTGDPEDEMNAAMIALNQSASIEQSPAPQKQRAGAAAQPREEPNPIQADQAQPNSSSSREIIRRGSALQRSGGESSQTQSEPQPWYRSGVGALGIVLALVVLAAWAVRRFLPGTRVTENGLIEVTARANITPKHSVALLHVGRRFVMVSMTGDRMERLLEVTDPDEVAELVMRTRVAGHKTSPFDELLIQESNAYEGVAHDQIADTIAQTRKRSTGRKALGELLNRLRSLQRK